MSDAVGDMRSIAEAAQPMLPRLHAAQNIYDSLIARVAAIAAFIGRYGPKCGGSWTETLATRRTCAAERSARGGQHTERVTVASGGAPLQRG